MPPNFAPQDLFPRNNPPDPGFKALELGLEGALVLGTQTDDLSVHSLAQVRVHLVLRGLVKGFVVN